ncbi:hypothetical protein AB0D46_36085 [Streptomyces sp. NPDC048383]|uniref:hypothetical protein n=1 Tax=Streptomyces sp. NPDC048383 TaxID=3155386 RepID=UPI003421CBCF
MTQNPGWGSGHHGGWGGYPPPPTAKPGVIPLRPLGAGDIISGSFSTLGRYWKQLGGVFLAVHGIWLLIVVAAVGIAFAAVHEHVAPVFDATDGRAPDREHLTPILLAGATLLFLLVVLGITSLALSVSLHQTVLRNAVLGRPVAFRALWRATWRRAPAVAGTVVLGGLIAAAPMLVVMAVWLPMTIAGAGASDDSAPGTVVLLPFLLILTMPLMVWLTTLFGLAPAAAVMEPAGPVTALRRSARLVKGDWWRVFGVTMLAGLIAGLVAWLIQLPFHLVALFTLIPAVSDVPDGGVPPLGALFLFVLLVLVGGIGGQLVQTGFMQLVSGLLYVDLRIRREGLAAELLRAVPAGSAAPVPSSSPVG